MIDLFADDPTPEPRVVSTSPSGTEICYALGVEPVAVSHSCDFPTAVSELPVIDRSRVTGETSGDRHDAVTRSQRSGGVYDVDEELLRTLDPDLVLSQSVCGVCAVDESLVRRVLDTDEGGPDTTRVLGLSASDLEDVFACIQQVGAATDRMERAAAVIGECWVRLETVRRSTPDDGPRVAVVEWMDPLHVAGNWVPELVTAAGGVYGLAEAGDRSVELEWQELLAYEPEVLVVAPCSYDAAETRERLGELSDRGGWNRLPAVRNDRVHVLDGAALNRWTPRLVDCATQLARLIHPDRDASGSGADTSSDWPT